MIKLKKYLRSFESATGILVGAALFVGCTSKIKIQSEPTETTVFVGQQNTLDRRPLGKAPLELTFNELAEKAGGSMKTGDYIVLTFEAKDYETEKLLLPVPVFGATNTNVFVKLQNSSEKKDSIYREILQRLHNAQKYAQASLFERALIETDKVLELDPKFERALSMKGSIYYLQKNYTEALKWFDEAIRVDPAFEEAIKMINKIKAEMKQ